MFKPEVEIGIANKVYAIQTTYLELVPITSCLHSFFCDHNFDPYSFTVLKIFNFFVLLVENVSQYLTRNGRKLVMHSPVNFYSIRFDHLVAGS